MSQTKSADKKFEPNATVKSGWGYWDTTHYAKGGCFRRANEDTRCRVDRKVGHEYGVTFADGSKGCVNSRALLLDTAKD